MKKFTKLFLSCMAVSAITAAVATSAMAAAVTGDVQGTYDEETGKLTIDNLTDLKIKDNTQATILVVGPNADVTAVKEGDIEYINQDANSAIATAWKTVGLLSAPAETKEGTTGTYTVMVGYEPAEGTEPFVVASGSFTIGGEPITLGEADGDADQIDSGDVRCVLGYANGNTAIAGNAGKTINLSEGGTLTVGEVDGDEDQVDSGDVKCILAYANGNEGIGNTGKVVTGTIAE